MGPPAVVEWRGITLCATLAAALAVVGALAQAPSVAITRVTLLEGRGGPPRPNWTGIVTDGIITDAEARRHDRDERGGRG